MTASGIWTGVWSGAALAGFLVGAVVPLPTPDSDAQALHGPTIVIAQPAVAPEPKS